MFTVNVILGFAVAVVRILLPERMSDIELVHAPGVGRKIKVH